MQDRRRSPPDDFAADLADRYLIVREVGRGASAVVFRARDLKHRREVAIKMLDGPANRSDGVARFAREIGLVARLQHPHILPLYDSGEAGGHHYFVMPFVAGESLRARLRAVRTLAPIDALRLAGELADALGYAHAQGVVHRDVKPENILLGGGTPGDADGWHALVCDFGLARVAEAWGGRDRRGGAALTKTGYAVGTLAYMAPEQAMADRIVGPPADVFALGVVLYELLTGVVPFTDTHPGPDAMSRRLTGPPAQLETRVPALPRHAVPLVDAVLARAMAPDPAARYRTGAEMVAPLRAALAAAHVPDPVGLLGLARARLAAALGRNVTPALGAVVLGAVALAGAAAGAPAGGQAPAADAPPAAPAGGYRQPPAPIAAMLDAEPLPAVSVSPDRRWLVRLRRRALPPISEVGAPELRLAGLRINPRTNAGSRDLSYTGLVFQPAAGGAEQAVALPGVTGEPRIGPLLWAPGGRTVAFTMTGPAGVTLWAVDAPGAAAGPAPLRARQVASVALNAALTAPCAWADAARLACLTVPSGRGAPPAPASAPTGPIEQESEGRAAPNPTFQDLLKSPADEALFEHYATAQVAVVGLDGRVTPFGTPAVRTRLSPSPDGRWLLVETAHRPYSYLVPLGGFPSRAEVWDASTGRVTRVVDDSPLDEQASRRFDQVPAGPRNLQWRGDAPATLAWVEALDGGDPQAKVAKHDALRSLSAPFAGAPVTHAQLEYRGQGVVWARPDLAYVTEGWRRTRRSRTWAFNPADPAQPPRLVFDRSSEDRYADPGRFQTAPNVQGRPVLLTTRDGRHAFLTGDGASAEGDRPFVDRYELATGKTERLFRSAAPHYEEPVAVLDPDRAVVLTRRESATEVPNYWRRPLLSREAPLQLTRLADPAPQFAGVTSKLVTYKRKDGVELSATVYLPAGYDQRRDGPLPFFLWAYPLEYGSAAAASQVIGSPYRFTRPQGASHLFLLTQGYGVMDNPTMPIVASEGKQSNDTYVEQLVASAEAAVDQLVTLGVGDRDRVAVGGHSYGAFMTANLLSHTSLFRAGVARSGAYNRTLTPFGFQGEERDYWRAQNLYTAMSPFTYADRVKTPLLLVHGMADDNQGTFPVQSERYYAALKGNGAKVRYVQLPAEAHGYRARESIGHTLYEMTAWLDRWVKPKRTPAVSAIQ